MSDTKTSKQFLGLTPEEIRRYAKKYPELVDALKMASEDEEIADLFRNDQMGAEAFTAEELAVLTDEGNPIVCDGDPDNPFYGASAPAFTEEDLKDFYEKTVDTPGFEVITFPDAPPTHPHLVFVYGSLLRGNHNNGRLKDDIFFRDAYTKPEYTLYSLGPFPGMVEGGNVSVRGELFWLSHESLKHLDAMEGHPTFYCRTLIELNDGSFAWTYIYQMGAHGILNPPVVESGYWKDHFTVPMEVAAKMNAERKAVARYTHRRDWKSRYDYCTTLGTTYYDKRGRGFSYDKHGRRVYPQSKSATTRLREQTDYSQDDLKARLDAFSSGTLYYDEDAVDSIQQLRLIGALNNSGTLETDPLPLSGRQRRRARRNMAKQEKATLRKMRREIKSGKHIPKAWAGEVLKWAEKVDAAEHDRPLSTWSDKKNN